MTRDDDRLPAAGRCPQCAARNAATAQWCTQCYAPLGGGASDVAAPAPVTVPVTDQPGTPDAERLLAELAAAERRPSPSPRLSALVATPGSRVAVMLVGTVLVSAVGFGLLALVGSVL